jgi:hypothetical protein
MTSIYSGKQNPICHLAERKYAQRPMNTSSSAAVSQTAHPGRAHAAAQEPFDDRMTRGQRSYTAKTIGSTNNRPMRLGYVASEDVWEAEGRALMNEIGHASNCSRALGTGVCA